MFMKHITCVNLFMKHIICVSLQYVYMCDILCVYIDLFS